MSAKLTATSEEEEFDTEAFGRFIAEMTWEMKAMNTVVIDLRGRVSYTDFVVVSTASSERHVQAIAKFVQTKVKQETGVIAYGTEGIDAGRWALIDFGDAILHIFAGQEREEYDLERMWSEAPVLELKNKPKSLYGHFEMAEFE